MVSEHQKNFRRAHCFILLVPDDSDEREWPIFEAGFLMGKMLPGDRLICLHHKDISIPHQLDVFQGIQADSVGIERLLRIVLIEPNVVPSLPPINPSTERSLPER